MVRPGLTLFILVLSSLSLLLSSDPSEGESRVPVPWPPFTKHHQPYLTINHKIAKSSVRYSPVLFCFTVLLCTIVFCSIVVYCTVISCILLCCLCSTSAVLYCVLLCGTVMYCLWLFHTAFYCALLYSFSLYSVFSSFFFLLYYTLLCILISHCTAFYSTSGLDSSVVRFLFYSTVFYCDGNCQTL